MDPMLKVGSSVFYTQHEAYLARSSVPDAKNFVKFRMKKIPLWKSRVEDTADSSMMERLKVVAIGRSEFSKLRQNSCCFQSNCMIQIKLTSCIAVSCMTQADRAKLGR